MTLNHAIIDGVLSIHLVVSKWEQPPIQAWAIRLRPESEARIHNAVNLSKDKDLVHRPSVHAYQWHLEPPCHVDIDQSLIKDGTVDWSAFRPEIPEVVHLTFKPVGGEVPNGPSC